MCEGLNDCEMTEVELLGATENGKPNCWELDLAVEGGTTEGIVGREGYEEAESVHGGMTAGTAADWPRELSSCNIWFCSRRMSAV